ncbi:MAG: hypothetical protein ACOX1S_06435 [Anaerostipes sp.]|jgi:hypothetical protein
MVRAILWINLVKQYMYEDTKLAILAIENQNNIQYFVPLKNMLYDSDFYNDQRKTISKTHKETYIFFA